MSFMSTRPSVNQFDKHLVLTGRQTRHADCIVVTRRFHPTPRQVVDVYVQMPDPLNCVAEPSGGDSIADCPVSGQGFAALRDFDFANVRFGQRRSFDDVRFTSAANSGLRADMVRGPRRAD
jgi:hypothetical protein